MMAEKMPMTVEMTVSEGMCAWRKVARLCCSFWGVECWWWIRGRGVRKKWERGLWW
jgi:hypothetical protein